MQEAPQFVSLPDALCDIVATLHKVRQPTHLDNVHAMLRRQYLGMAIPRKETILATLDSLTSEGRLCKMGDIYFSPWAAFNPYCVVPPQTPFSTVPPQTPFSTLPPQPVFSPYNFDWWSGSLPRQTETSKPQLCSAECQTGASIVNGVTPYNPNPGGVPNPAPPATQPPKAECKEKRSIIEKLFRRRSKSKTQEDGKSAKNSKTPVRSTSADSNFSSVAKTEPRAPQNPENPPEPRHLAFSAQFPPPEWLYRPVIAKQPRNRLSFIAHRTSEEDGSGSGEGSGGVFQTWVDTIPHGQEFKSRRRTGDLRFASQRAPVTIFEETEPIQVREAKRIKHKQRLSKYLSSSSECLQSIDFQGDFESNSSKKRSKSKNSNEHRTTTFTKPSGTLSPMKYPGEKVPKSFEVTPPRLLTSTPTPPAIRSEPQEKESESKHEEQRWSPQNDSALSSASPVDSGPPDRNRKYSSWSSVEEPMEHVFERSINLSDLPSANHTYENVKNEHTYENLGKTLDATKYEDITNYAPPKEPENAKRPNDVAPRISRTCVSAL